MSIYAPLLGHLWHVLDSYGVDPREVIHASHFRPNDPAQTSRRIRFSDYDATLARAVARVGDPALGVRSARYFNPSYLGALGYAWLASSSLRAAIHRIVRLSRMFNEQLRLEVEESPRQVRLVYGSRQPVREADVIADGHVANLLQLCRIIYGPELQPEAVTLTLPAPSDPAPWIAHYGPVVRFGQADNSFTLGAADADAPLTGSHPELVALHEDIVERYLLKLDRDNVLNRLRLELMQELPSGRVTEDAMAAALNMSKRTLHRKLRENDETFRSVLAQVRRELAQHYVRTRDFSITEIAFLLGYNDTSAFSRAFRNWFGRSPSDARERVQAA
jgi:AraC-like DNA-binding protein